MLRGMAACCVRGARAAGLAAFRPAAAVPEAGRVARAPLAARAGRPEERADVFAFAMKSFGVVFREPPLPAGAVSPPSAGSPRQ
jgi:hypothetical protein